jgi:hypothetical protein
MSPLLRRFSAKAAAWPTRMAVILTLVAAAPAVVVPHPAHAKAKEVLVVVPGGLANGLSCSGVATTCLEQE